jgi:hypothetical protein
MSGWILGQRLIAHGVKFEYTPERAHSQNHGHERDTFLVDGDYSTLVVARTITSHIKRLASTAANPAPNWPG